MREKRNGTYQIAFVLLLIVAVAAGFLINKYSPSKEVMDLKDYYKITEEKDEAVVILQDEIIKNRGIISGKTAYLDLDTVKNILNTRFYWDRNENLLIFTTPSDVIKTEAGSTDYYINKSRESTAYPIVKTNGDKIYVAADFVQKYSNIDYKVYDNPNRIVVNYKWGEYLYADVKKKTQVRYRAGIKSPVLKQVKKNDKLTILVEKEQISKKFTKVLTGDGVIGYVRNNKLSDTYYKTLKNPNDFKEPEYTSISSDGPVKLVWHQVTRQLSNSGLLSLLNRTNGVTAVSPTWFSVNSSEGTISSIASNEYVKTAHKEGVEVWGLVDDFNPKVKVGEVLAHTSKRERLINDLIANAIKYNLDGLNIDFENIKKQYADDFIQFIRELSIKCRSNNIILSVDNYVPTDYSAYYNRKEQGIVADYVITMAYDEHHAGSEESGSVASYDYVKNAIDNILEIVPKEKNIIAIPFYTRLWEEVKKDGKNNVTSKAYSMNDAAALLANKNVKTKWDDKLKQYYGEYKENGAVYKMWLEEDKSVEAKMKLIHEADVAGVAGWKLGLEKESTWNIINKYMN